MGEARRKRALIEHMLAERKSLEAVVAPVAHALRRLAEAASASLGSDCYTHAQLGRVLLADQGLVCEPQVGFAAWRVGTADGDVISHTIGEQSYLPEGAVGFPYHAWLTHGDWLIDITTYQLARKGQELDAADGGHTNVDWCPDYLLLHRSQVRSYQDVRLAAGAGFAHYDAQPVLARRMAQGYELDADDVATARLIVQNPNMKVLGPNSIG